MITNVGVIDRVLRLAIGLALIGWAEGYFGQPPEGRTETQVVYWLGLAFTFTGAFRFSAVYALFRINTCARDDTRRRT